MDTDLNHCTLTGILERDPVVKFADHGTQQVSFTLRLTEAVPAGQAFTLFVPCEAYGQARELTAAARPAPAGQPPPAPAPARPEFAEPLAACQAALPGSRGEAYLRQRGIPLALAQPRGVGYVAPGGPRLRRRACPRAQRRGVAPHRAPAKPTGPCGALGGWPHPW